MCNTTEDIKNAKLTYGKTVTIDYMKPCNRISKLNFDGNYSQEKRGWRIYITFPDEVKLIIQSKEVDIHGLVGNVGGYLGLFMGYAIVQAPTLLFNVYDFLRTKF